MIQEKDFLYRVPVKTAPITTPKGQIRNPEILVDLEGGEFMHGNILDANSTNKLINQSVKEAVDNKIIEGGSFVTKDLLDAETSARTNGDEDLNTKIKAEQTRAESKEKEISDKLAIVDGDSNTEGSFRKAIADVIAAAPEDLDTLKEIADKLADSDDLHTALNQAITEKADASALANEVTRATSAESNLQTAIDAKQDAGNYIPCDSTDTSSYDIDRTIKISGELGYTTLGNGHIFATNNTSSFEIDSTTGAIQLLSGTRDDSTGLKLGYNGLRIGEKADINADNGELISISRQHNTITYIFKVKDNTIENNKIKIDEFGLTNDKPSTGNSSHALYITNSALHGAILVESNADLSIGYDNSILDRPFWKFGQQGAEFNGSDGQKRIDIQAGNPEYANIFGIKLSNNVFNQNSHIDNPCEIQNDRDYVSFSKKIKVSDIITDATTDSSLNTVLSKKVDTEAFNGFSSSVSGQLNSFNGALSTFGGQIALKQDKITVNSIDVTDIETADITKLRTIVKNLIDALSESGLIRMSINIE